MGLGGVTFLAEEIIRVLRHLSRAHTGAPDITLPIVVLYVLIRILGPLFLTVRFSILATIIVLPLGAVGNQRRSELVLRVGRLRGGIVLRVVGGILRVMPLLTGLGIRIKLVRSAQTLGGWNHRDIFPFLVLSLRFGSDALSLLMLLLLLKAWVGIVFIPCFDSHNFL